MKKIQVFLTVFAILTASAGVFATNYFADTFWLPSGLNDCAVSISSVCAVGDGPECKTSEGVQVYYRINGEGPCIAQKRPTP